MYKKQAETAAQMRMDAFVPPFGGNLKRANRWVRAAREIDWALVEEDYARHFAASGKTALPVRCAVGALVVQKVLGLSDAQLLMQIEENYYVQYFLGFNSPLEAVPFSKSALKLFRDRVSPKLLNALVRAVNNALDAPDFDEWDEGWYVTR